MKQFGYIKFPRNSTSLRIALKVQVMVVVVSGWNAMAVGGSGGGGRRRWRWRWPVVETEATKAEDSSGHSTSKTGGLPIVGMVDIGQELAFNLTSDCLALMFHVSLQALHCRSGQGTNTSAALLHARLGTM